MKRFVNGPEFKRNGWPFLLISLGAILRGLLYIPGVSNGHPAGLEAIIGSNPILFTVYCLLWISSGIVGIWASVTGNRLVPISLIVGLCGLWAGGYIVQFFNDYFHGDYSGGLTYLGAVTYLSFGAAVLRYPVKG